MGKCYLKHIFVYCKWLLKKNNHNEVNETQHHTEITSIAKVMLFNIIISISDVLSLKVYNVSDINVSKKDESLSVHRDFSMSVNLSIKFFL